MDNIQVIVKDNQEVVSLYLSTPTNVKSFNGRDGVVTSQSGDYSAFDNNFTTEQTFTDMTVTGSTDFPTQVKTDDGPSVATTAFVQSLLQDVSAGLKFKGTWNADTNTPSLTSSSGEDGNFYIVDVSGDTDLNGITDWQVGDWAVFVDADGASSWKKVDNSSVLDGQGTANYVPKWSGLGTSMTLGDSIIYDDGTNVGIGTSSPLQKLHVDGAIVSGNSTEGVILTKATGVGSVLGVDAGFNGWNDLDIRATSATQLYLNTSGNVGIGTDSPDDLLVLKESGGNDAKINILKSDGSQKALIGYDNGNGGLINLYNEGGDRNVVVRGYGNSYFNGGNVGIGTDSPSAKLHLADTSDVYLTLESTDTSTTEEVAIKYSNFNTGANYWWQGLNQSENWSLGYGTSFSGSTTKLFVNSSGNVGIGTTAPSTKLEVVSDANEEGISIVDSSSNLKYKVRQFTGYAYSSFYDASNTEQVRINSNGTSWFNGGNVGIGTTSPDEKLRVDGNAKVAGDVISAALKLGFAGSANITTNDTNEDLLINPNGSGDILMQTTSTGNVGIGTTVPNQKFGVNGNINIAGGESSYLTFNNGDANIKIHNNDVTVVGRDLGFETYKDGVGITEKMRITRDGNVGIGTASPLAKLHVKDGSVLSSALANTSALIEGFSQSILQIASHSTGYSQIAFGDQNDGFDGGFVYSNASRYLSIETANSEKMRIDSSGNVGIGTDAPSEKLEVEGTIKVVHTDDSYANYRGQGVFFNRTENYIAPLADNTSTLNIGYNGAKFGNIEINGAFIKFENGPNEFMRITSGGNVGIGTDAPSEKLHVDGNIRVNSGTQGLYSSFVQAISSTGLKIGNDDFSGYAYFNNDGNVGIGTDAPSEKLEVDGNVKVGGNVILGVADSLYLNGTTGLRMLHDGANALFINQTAGDFKIQNSATDKDIIFRGQDGISSIDALTLDMSEGGNATFAGNVKLGDNNKLLLGTGEDLQILHDGSNSYIAETGTGALFIDSSKINFQINGSTAMNVNFDSKVGIGTTNPSEKLEVEGGNISVKDDGAGMILSSPNGTKYKITVANDGTLTSTAV